jgi:hypothetical protein
MRRSGNDTLEVFYSGLDLATAFEAGSTGFESGRDEILVAFSPTELRDRLQHFCTSSPSIVEAEYSVKEGWGLHLFKARKHILRTEAPAGNCLPVLMAPFDVRSCFFRKDLLKTNSWSAGQHLRHGDNLAIVCMRQVVLDAPYRHVLVSRVMVNNRAFASQKGKASYYPIRSMPENSLLANARSDWNIKQDAMDRMGLDAKTPQAGWQFAHLILAETLAPSYADFFDDAVWNDFPRVFRPRNPEAMKRLLALGADLAALQLLEADYPFASWNQPGATRPDPLATLITTFQDEGDREVRKVGEKGKIMAPSPKGQAFGRVYINETAYFDGVPEDVWNFHIGGYQVCHKWLSDRKGSGSGKNRKPGRTLTDEDIAHYHRIVIALNETIRLMGEIDEVIEEHGGWPGAFVTEKGED